MNKKIFFLILIGIVSVGVIVLSKQNHSDNSNTGSVEAKVVDSSSQNFQSKTVTLGSVVIEATPTNITAGEEIIFEISFNTHSVDLNFDIASVVSLQDNFNTNYQQKNWSGGSGGHHLSGTMTFDQLEKNVAMLTLVLSDIDGQSATLSWEL